MTALSTPVAERVDWLDNPWVRFAVRRGRRLVISLLVLISAAFLMVRLIPGNPIRQALGSRAPASLVLARERALGLDKPLLSQYVDYFHNLFTGHWGTSFVSQEPVLPQIGQLIVPTLEIAFLAFALTLLLAIPSGVLMAILTRNDRHRGAELGFTWLTAVMASIPDYLFGVGLVYVFGVSLHLLPIAGRSGISSYVLPVLALSLGAAAILARIVRLEMLTALRSDYVRMARAKRLPAVTIYLRHTLPNALTATLTVSGMILTGLVAGTVLVETVFAWPGLGSTIVSSITAKDYPMVQAITLVYGVGILLINLIVDVAVAIIDPRSAIKEA